MNRLFKTIHLLSLFIGIGFPVANAQEIICTLQNKALCEQKLEGIKGTAWQAMATGEIAAKAGKLFMNTPYVANTLEINGSNEKLIVNLGELDCTTFLENAIVLSRLVQKQAFLFENFTKELEHLRYRDGHLETYASRLHYFTEWIANNEVKGIIEDVTQKIGGAPYDKPIDFMSNHRKSYPALADDIYYADIQKREEKLNQQKRYFIPQEKIESLEKNIEEGDLIAITTSIKGLDVSHVGLATWENNRLHLLHASSSLKKVVVSEKPLADYILGNKTQSGIIVARLSEVQ